MKRQLTIFLLILIWGTGWGFHSPVPEKEQADLFLKLLSTLRLPIKQKKTTFSIAIVYNPKLPNSRQKAMDFLEMFLLFKNRKIQEKDVNPKLIAWYSFFNPYNPPPVPDAILILKSGKIPVQKILKYAFAKKIPTLAIDSQLVENGAAMGVVLDKNEQPQILLNMSTLKKINLEPEAELLQIAKLYY